MAECSPVVPTSGLTPAAHKVALRLSQLPDGRAYKFTLLKQGDKWVLWIEDAKGWKLEVCK